MRSNQSKARVRVHPTPLLAALGLGLACSGAAAHVTLAPGGAMAGSRYEAAFRVGHACKDTAATTGITVRLPAGFELEEVLPRTGWTVSIAGRQVSWQATSPQAALPNKERAEFVLRGRVTPTSGVLWFPVLQACGQDSADWAQIPSEATPKPEFPAARLDVLPAGVAAVHVRGAWTAPAVAGQEASAVFMNLSAPSGLRLVAASTPVAGTAYLSATAANGALVRKAQALELPPRELVELKPGGDQITLVGLKQVLAAGAILPLTLHFEDASGARSRATIDIPVLAGDDQRTAAEPAR
jgi:hypothetical protein